MGRLARFALDDLDVGLPLIRLRPGLFLTLTWQVSQRCPAARWRYAAQFPLTTDGEFVIGLTGAGIEKRDDGRRLTWIRIGHYGKVMFPVR